MAEDLDARYRRLLGKQLTMNALTWAALQSHGVTQATQLRLEFSYVTPAESNALALKAVLNDQTDYDVRVGSEGRDSVARWLVIGTTQPTAVSLAILDQWVDWMVSAGVQQGCDFDGWGAEVER